MGLTLLERHPSEGSRGECLNAAHFFGQCVRSADRDAGEWQAGRQGKLSP